MDRYIRRQLNSTGKMRCDICKEVHILVQHHINGRKVDNPHKENNLCNICDNCHRKVHAGEINVEGWIMTTSGMMLLYNSKP